jgi:hypothetical protein
VSSYEHAAGFRLAVDTYLFDQTEPHRERRLTWHHDYSNRILLRYDLDAEYLTCICYVDEQTVVFESIDIPVSEWNGSDDKWHTLEIQVLDGVLTVYRDQELLMEHRDSLIAAMPRTGYVELANKCAETCFDNVVLTSLTQVPFICGDADGNGIVNISDAVYLIAYVFAGGAGPDPLEAGDSDCNEIINISDAVYLIAYIFGGGPEPCAATNR